AERTDPGGEDVHRLLSHRPEELQDGRRLAEHAVLPRLRTVHRPAPDGAGREVDSRPADRGRSALLKTNRTSVVRSPPALDVQGIYPLQRMTRWGVLPVRTDRQTE